MSNDYEKFKELIVDEIRSDRVVTKTTKCEQEAYSEHNDCYKLIKYKDYSLLTTNLSKTKNDINMGADLNEHEQYIASICDNLDIEKIKHNVVEYCLNIEIDYKSKNYQHIYNSFKDMLAIEKFKDSWTSEHNEITNRYVTGVKGKKTDLSLKLYSKLEEKNKSEITDKDILRLEITYYSRNIERRNIRELKNIEKVKKDLKKYLRSWAKQLPKKLNRYTSKTNEIINKFKKIVDN